MRKPSDKKLGMQRAITRRDFVQGAAVATGAALQTGALGLPNIATASTSAEVLAVAILGNPSAPVCNAAPVATAAPCTKSRRVMARCMPSFLSDGFLIVARTRQALAKCDRRH